METRKLLKDGLYVGNATWLHDFAVTRNLSGLLPHARKVMRKFASWAVNNPLYYRPLDEILTDPQLPEADRLHLAALKKSHDYPVRWLLLGESSPFAQDAAALLYWIQATEPRPDLENLSCEQLLAIARLFYANRHERTEAWELLEKSQHLGSLGLFDLCRVMPSAVPLVMEKYWSDTPARIGLLATEATDKKVLVFALQTQERDTLAVLIAYWQARQDEDGKEDSPPEVVQVKRTKLMLRYRVESLVYRLPNDRNLRDQMFDDITTHVPFALDWLENTYGIRTVMPEFARNASGKHVFISKKATDPRLFFDLLQLRGKPLAVPANYTSVQAQALVLTGCEKVLMPQVKVTGAAVFDMCASVTLAGLEVADTLRLNGGVVNGVEVRPVLRIPRIKARVIELADCDMKGVCYLEADQIILRNVRGLKLVDADGKPTLDAEVVEFTLADDADAGKLRLPTVRQLLLATTENRSIKNFNLATVAPRLDTLRLHCLVTCDSFNLRQLQVLGTATGCYLPAGCTVKTVAIDSATPVYGSITADTYRITLRTNQNLDFDKLSNQTAHPRSVELLYRGAAGNLPPKLKGEAVVYPEDEETWFGRKLVCKTLWYILTRPVTRTRLLIDMLSGIESKLHLVAPDASFFPPGCQDVAQTWLLPESLDFDPAEWPNLQAFRSRLKRYVPNASLRVVVEGKEREQDEDEQVQGEEDADA